MCEIIFSRIFLGFPLLLWMAGGPTHAACPIELNPLTLVVRYGDSVSVNCSTSSTDYEGMGWEATLGGTALEEVNYVIWNVENLTDWTIQPVCYLTQKDGEQCLKRFPVTLYKTPGSVSVYPQSHSGPMVEGTEYQLQCDIQKVAPLRSLVVRWYKGNETVKTETFHNSTRIPVDVFSTLNITPRRYEDEVKYRCEAELDLGPKGPLASVLSSQTLHFAVYFPPQNILELRDTEVDVGSPIGLNCSSDGNPRPEYSWTYHRAPNVKLKNNDGGSLLTIEQATGENIGTYTCHASNTLGEVFKIARVSVRAAEPVCPIKLIPESVVVKYGSPISVSCRNTTSVEEIYWTTGPEVVNDTTWSVLELLDWDIRPGCKATFQGIGRCSKPLHITVYKTPDSVSISVLRHSGPMVEGTQYQLQCDIQNIAPLQNLVVKWYKGNEPLDHVTYSTVSKTPVDVSATLMISPRRDDDGAQYRCRAELDLGPEGPQHTVTSEPLSITVHYKPCINASGLPVRIPVFRGYPEELVCEAEGYPQPRIKWVYDPAKHVREAGGNLTVFEAGLYNCTATNIVETSFIVVEVVLNEDYLPLIAGFVAFMVVVISVIFVAIYSIYYKNTKMGRYSLKKAKLSSTPSGNVAQNGGRDTPLPMTKLSQPNINFEENELYWDEPLFPLVWYVPSQPSSQHLPEHSRVYPMVHELAPPPASLRTAPPSFMGIGEGVRGVVSLQANSRRTSSRKLQWNRRSPAALPLGGWSKTARKRQVNSSNWSNATAPSLHTARHETRAVTLLWPEGAGSRVDDCQVQVQLQEEPLAVRSQTPDSVSISVLKHSGPMVEGTQYQLQCDIQNIAPLQNLVVKWYKGNEPLDHVTYSTVSKTPVDVSATLMISPSRDDDGAQAFVSNHSSLWSCQAGPSRNSTRLSTPIIVDLIKVCKKMENYFLKWILNFCMFCTVSGEGCSLELKPSRVVVGFGEPVSVSCEASRPVRVLGWESAIGAAHTQQDRAVQWKVDSLIDWIEEPICYGVFFTAPRQCEEKLNLILYKTPDSVTISSANHTGPMLEGKEYQLLCDVQNIAPVQYLTLRWYRGQTEVYNHSFSDLTPASPVQVSSILLITPTKADNGAQYKCVAQLDLGPEGPQPPPSVTSEPLNVSVHYPPSFLSPEAETLDIGMGDEITLNCTATGSPSPVYSWQSSDPKNKMEDLPLFTSSSLLPGTYTCISSNKIGKKSKQFIIKTKS
uniref:hemicentin-1-like n=1 Tax=Oncorhynchus gorbuscha TaxID=8017 RepID=UPI001EAEBCF8|nr:hemicentin-1-like [Oncorhynchus gorbuscha]